MKDDVVRATSDRLVRLGAAQHGVVTGWQLGAAGFTRAWIRNVERQGILLRLARDIYRLRDHPWTWEAQLRALLFDAGPRSYVSHRSAARLHGLWRYRSSAAVEVTAQEMHAHRVTLGRLHRSSRLVRAHQTVVAGFPVSTVARTCFDLMGDPEPALRRSAVGLEIHGRDMLRVVNDALSRGLTLGQLVAVRVELAKRGRPGSALARSIVDRLGPSYVPTTTDGEHLFAELVAIYQLPAPQRQVPVSDHEGWIGTVDFMYGERRLIVEIDGGTHERPLDREHDARRDERMRTAGYDVWRVPYLQLLRRPEAVMRELRSRLRRPADAA
jgi:very-short-patch-repair endonuclease